MSQQINFIPAVRTGAPQALGSIFGKVSFEMTFDAVTNRLDVGDYATLFVPDAGYKIAGAQLEVTTVGPGANLTLGDGTVEFVSSVPLDALGATGEMGDLGDELRIICTTTDAIGGTVKVTAFVVDAS